MARNRDSILEDLRRARKYADDMRFYASKNAGTKVGRDYMDEAMKAERKVVQLEAELGA